MDRAITFTKAAAQDIYQTALWYRGKSENLDQDFLAYVDEALNMLERFPECGVPVGVEVRRMVMRQFPFSLFYSVHPRAIVVIAVLHHRHGKAGPQE